jgi:hypothetical protein
MTQTFEQYLDEKITPGDLSSSLQDVIDNKLTDDLIDEKIRDSVFGKISKLFVSEIQIISNGSLVRALRPWHG